MAFNPKVKSLDLVESKDINKKAIDKLAKKHNATTGKKASCFIKLEHTFKDGTVGPLFVFGKLNAFKNQIKDLLSKEATKSLKAMAHVEFDDKGKPTLVISPVKGKLHNKLTELQKAMKAAFTTAYSDFKIAGEIDEKLADTMADAAAAEPDEDDEDENQKNTVAATPKVEAAAKPKTPEEEKKEAAEVAFFTKANNIIGPLMEKLNALNKANADPTEIAAASTEVENAFKKIQSGKLA